MRIAAFYNGEWLTRKLYRKQQPLFPAAIGLILYRLSLFRRLQYRFDHPSKIHIGTGDLFPPCHSLFYRKIKIIHMKDPCRELPCKQIGKRGLPACTPAVNSDDTP